MADELLQAGIAAFKAGATTQAEAHFAQLIKVNPNSDLGWLWLGKCQAIPERRAYCLKRALALNPNLDEARQLLSPPKTPPPPPLEVARPQPVQQVRPITPVRSAPVLAKVEEVDGTTAPASTPIPAKPLGVGGVNKVILAAIGVVAALLLCGLPVGYLIFSGTLSRWLGREAAVAPAPLPTLAVAIAQTPTVAPTLEPSATPTPTTPPTVRPTADYATRLEAVQGEISRIRRMQFSGQEAEAIELLDKVIEQVPEYADGYYRRAQSYVRLTDNQRYLEEYQRYLYSALENLNQAIALDATRGSYFLMRSEIYESLANLEDLSRANHDALLTASLDDLRRSLLLGNENPGSPSWVPVHLANLGQCDESLQETRKLQNTWTEAADFQNYLQYALALGYLCKGQLDTALTHISQATSNSANWGYHYTQAAILYQQKRYAQALTDITAQIEEQPYYCGCRYYLRALIYLELGEPEKALQDLEFGAGQTWEHGGTFLYGHGQLALQAGKTEEGWQLIQLAEASTDRTFTALNERIRKEMAQNNVELLPAEAELALNPEPLPEAPAAITLDGGRGAPLNPGLRISLEKGYGPFQIAGGGWAIFHIAPDQPLTVNQPQAFTIRVRGALVDSKVQVWVWRQTEQDWQELSNRGVGQFEIDDSYPEDYVSSAGDVFVLLVSDAEDAIIFESLGATITAQNADGTAVTFGLTK